MYTPNGSPDTRFEALIVRTPWPEFVARLERERYDNAKFVPVQLVDHTAGYDGECAVLFPETVSVARAPDQQLRRHLLRPRGGALPAVDRAGRRGAAHRPAARRRRPRRERRPRARRLHPLGHDPRPLAQPRRSALRSLHDPPAPALLDVLARGAARRPRHLRHGRRDGARRLCLRALHPVRDRLRPHPAIPHHRQPGAQLRRPRRTASVRLAAPAAASCAGPTTAC